MLFQIVDKSEFEKLVGILLESNEVVGPKVVDRDKNGKPLYQYLPVSSFKELALDYDTTEYSAKSYFMPYQETLSTFRLGENGWTQEIRYRLMPRAFIGLHACDINGLLKMDKVMMSDVFPSPYYISRRKNTFIVGIDHESCQGGFCSSLGTDTVFGGFDLYLTDLGDRYFVAIDSNRGFLTLRRVKTREVMPGDTERYLEVRKAIRRSYTMHVDTHNLTNLLDIEFESEVWKKWGAKCLSCGSCAMVCPTCYCYGVSERVSLDNKTAWKIKQLYSCNLVDFAQVAGGHNFRPGRETRLKYRYYHVHRGFVETYEESKCVGCGRCGRACPSGINPPDVIRDLQAEVRS